MGLLSAGQRKVGISPAPEATCMGATSETPIFLVGMALLVAILALGMR